MATPRAPWRLLVMLATLFAAGLAAQPQAPAADARERAWRANNVGVAHLEQFDFEAATAAFREGLASDPSLATARLNLGIARFYAGDLEGARAALEAVRTALPDRPQPDYVLGLIARAENRTADAIAAFSRAAAMDPRDAGIAINLGQLFLQERRYADAVARFQAAIAAEPYNATAAYGLATALSRSGAPDAEAATERFQTLRTSAYAVTYSQNYLEQGRYAEGLASTGAEPDLVDARTPDVRFTPSRGAIPGAAAASNAPASLTLADLDLDGDLDLIDASSAGVRLLRNDGGRFSDMTDAVPLSLRGPANAALAGDYDNDRAVDLLLLRPSGVALLHRTGTNAFTDVTARAGLGTVTGPFTTAAWVDLDHDGDLDIVAAGAGADTRVLALRNNGDGTFADVSTATTIAARGITSIVPSDFDNRRDVDLLLVGGPAALFSNRRDGTFTDVAADAGLSVDDAAMAATGDVNKDGAPDFVFARTGGPARIALSDGRGRFALSDAPAGTAGARAVLLVDYDNDGLLDLMAAGPRGLALFRNLGDRWTDVTTSSLAAAADTAGVVAMAAGDLDGDGDTDLAVRVGARIEVLTNDGGSRHASLRVRLAGRTSNRSAAGVKVEMRAGSLRGRMETSIATPAAGPSDVVFGLGTRRQADSLRVLWPSGILQAETGIGDAGAPLTGAVTLEELDRKPSSCPYLFTWNGSRFEFITDFLGGGEMGYLVTPGTRNVPMPGEYVRIAGDRLVPRDGRLQLRVTNELEEALFLDRLQLVSVAHPSDVEVYPNAGLRETPEPFTLYRTRAPRAVVAATDDHGHDARDLLADVDRRSVEDFALASIRGYAAPHALTLTLPSAPSGRRLLLLTGWTDYAFSGDNVAASQRGLTMVPPSLQVPDGTGGWRTIIEDIGFPAGRPQTVTVDLTDKLPATETQVRILTNMRIYWDRIVVADPDSTLPVTLTRLEAMEATLRWRGFSEEGSPDGRQPWTYDYGRVSTDSPWKLLPGRYTREGDVRALLDTTDDLFVVSRPGDEVALSFDASALPALPDGWTRTWLLYGDGFSKEMDLHSSSPDTLDPLPFHAMSAYPYAAPESYPDTDTHRAYRERYNTRIVARPLPPIELVARP